MKTLLLLRHAKSDWDHPGLSDHQRPLNSRGLAAADKMGAWMNSQQIQPEWIICSTATRTRETLAAVTQHLQTPEAQVQLDDTLYLASTNTLLQLLEHCPPERDHILLIGHNPGIEELVECLCGRTANPSGMATATLAQIQLPDDWQALQAGAGKLLNITRAKEIN